MPRFVCEACGGEYDTEWTTGEAEAEALRIFGVENASQKTNMAVVCDDCFEKLKKLWN